MFTLIFIIKRLRDHDQPQKLYVRVDIKQDIAFIWVNTQTHLLIKVLKNE